jgi:hypothetical protein
MLFVSTVIEQVSRQSENALRAPLDPAEMTLQLLSTMHLPSHWS